MMFKYMCLVLFITWYQLAECHPASSNVKAMDSMIEKESEAFLSVEAEDSSHKNVRDKRTIGFLRQLFPNLSQPLDSDNTVGTGIVKRTAREVSTNKPSSTKKRSPLTDTDNDVSSDNALSSNSGDDAQAETVADEDPRNKRFLFNLQGGAGGGSGNFLFDLIRLVAGSGANQDKDESFDSVPAEAGETQEVHADVNAKEDGYSVGVPGPLTRIFVIANRGVANLVQDLILRLAQTTERIVNFKARLITSLI